MLFSPPPRFVSHPLFRGGHLQTSLPYLLKSEPSVYRATQHAVTVGQEDEVDQVILHDDCPVTWLQGQRVVVLVHGLGGCHGSGYMVRLASRFFARGYRVFRMDMRGCGAGLYRAAGVFHADRNEDLRRALLHVERLCPKSGITVCGFSLGANLTLKMLSAAADRLPSNLDSALVVGPPVDLGFCCRNLSKGLGRIYDRWYANLLWRDFSLRRNRLRRSHSVTITRAPKSIFEFDLNVTTKLGGYDTVDEYYQSGSAGPDLSYVTVPTAILMADDDPIVPACVLDDVRLSSCIQPFVVEGGGHLGFYSRKSVSGDPDERWMDWRLIQWVDETDAHAESGHAGSPVAGVVSCAD